MNYRAAYELLAKAVWEYDKTHNDAYMRLMLAMRDIDSKVGESSPPIILAGKRPKEPEE